MTDQEFIHMRRQEGTGPGVREHRPRRQLTRFIKRLGR